MSDLLLRTIAKNAGVRVLLCETTELVRECYQQPYGTVERHQLISPVASETLAHALTGVALMGALLKVRQRVAIRFSGDGPLEKVVVESDSYGKVRGYVAEPAGASDAAPSEFTLQNTIGSGSLTVVKDIGLKDLLESYTAIQSGGVDANLTAYLNQSEQIPSTVEIGVLVDEDGNIAMAGGLLIQALPGSDSAEIVARLTDRIGEIPPIANLLQSGHTLHDIAEMLLHDIPYDVLEERQLKFHCTCSWERSEKALISLGRAQIEALMAEGEVVIDCHFCHQRYVFDQNDLRTILEMTH